MTTSTLQARRCGCGTWKGRSQLGVRCSWDWRWRCATAGREWTPSVEGVTLARDANHLARNERIPGAHAAVRAARDGAPPGGETGLLEDLQRTAHARRGSAPRLRAAARQPRGR